MLNHCNEVVTPLVGVWIETMTYGLLLLPFMSLPSWECGLKLNMDDSELLILVTPLVGVWIETELTTHGPNTEPSLPSW